jgi:protein tyrosine/serine phosphatase
MLRSMFRAVFLLMAVAAFASAGERDARWAAKLEQPGLPNLHRVNGNMYRCAQPTAEGMRAAEKLGIRTVISLRAFHSDNGEVESTKLKTERIYFKTWHPEDEDVVRFLKLIANTNNGPFLVHCQHGADRTGTMVAIYRITVQGWSKNDAIKEMTEGGFGYHAVWSNLVRYLNELDIKSLRKKAGLVR